MKAIACNKALKSKQNPFVESIKFRPAHTGE